MSFKIILISLTTMNKTQDMQILVNLWGIVKSVRANLKCRKIKKNDKKQLSKQIILDFYFNRSLFVQLIV
jgi:hypothetical protein